MKTSEYGKNFIKSYEKLKLKSYKCLASEKYYTIGWGHYGVGANMTITKERAEEYFEQDIADCEKKVMKYDATYHWTQTEFDALVSFCFNLGQVSQLTASGKRSRAAISNKMLEYCHSGGVKIDGLLARRRAEQLMFDTKVHEDKSLNTIASEVIAGKWGNGASRRIKLESAGYNYKEVQAIVNQMIKAR